jgi:calpain-15
LGNFKDKSAKQYEKETDWIRAEHLQAFKGKRPQLFEGEIEPDDLCQGAVGDCWLVAAFACASEFPHVIRHQFLTKEYNPRGLYKVRIYDPQRKSWVVVKVDDRIPCKKGTKKPHFMSPNGNELWALILEKAYAKFCGSYANIEGKNSVEEDTTRDYEQ